MPTPLLASARLWLPRAAGIVFLVLAPSAAAQTDPAKPRQTSEGLHGYIHMSIAPPPAGFGYGVSFYAPIWPLLEKPLAGFQIGLPSIWIVPDNRDATEPLVPVGTVARDHMPERGPTFRDVFQTIEGGMGFWVSTQFGSPTAKFRINGTPDGYTHEISSPGWGFGNPTALRPEVMGLAQLSNRLLIPPDGMTFQPGMSGELFGNAWMVLPFTAAKRPAGDGAVPTGGQSWTLFINAANYQGPVAFWAPDTWSRLSRGHPPAVGRGLDVRAGVISGGAIEINTVPQFASTDANGVGYSRIPRLQFPVDAQGQTVLMQDVMLYALDALHNPVQAWFRGGPAASGQFDRKAARVPKCSTSPLALRQGPKKTRLTGINTVADTAMLGESSFGLKWARAERVSERTLGYLPDYLKQEGDHMVAIAAADVPDETLLKQQSFAPARKGRPYTAPAEPGTCWTMPGPKQGPFTIALSDGTTLTYAWYRFVDQPSLQGLRLSAAEKDRLQAAVELVHAGWPSGREYMPAPSRGTLATLDPALLVAPPAGLEVGYVPIVTRQEAR